MKKNKFLFSFLAGILILSACSNEDLGEMNKPNLSEQTPTTRAVSKAEAEAFANKAVDALYAFDNTPLVKTKSSTDVDVASVKPVYSDDGTVVLYVANFDSDGGYMIVSADKESSSAMLAFNDKGSIDVDNLDENNPMALWLEEKKQQIAQSLKEKINPDDESYQMWDGIAANDSIEIEIELVDFQTPGTDDPITKGRHKNSWGLAGQGVGYSVTSNLWGQGTGYNADAPVSGALAGCPAVAVGLLCKYWHFPSEFEYSSMPMTLNTSSSNPISRMFRNIADRIPNYRWGRNASGATEPNITTGLRSLGYKNVTYTSYNFNTVYNNISQDRPVLLGGFGGGGHIWICDGYWEQQWKVTRKFLGIKVKTWYEYVDMLYMNWGWNGKGNGWIDQADWNSNVNGSFNNNRGMWTNLYPVR